MRSERICIRSGMVWAAVGLTVGLFGGLARGEEGTVKHAFGFGPMEILKMEYELGIPQAADLNGDGRNDLVIVNNHKSRIDVLLQKKDFNPQDVKPAAAEEEDINDLFGRESQWRFKRVSIPLDVKATSLAVEDLNNDTFPDLAWYSPQGIYVLLQEKAEANDAADGMPAVPSWKAATKIDLRRGANHPYSLLAADMNYDDLSDLILQGENEYYVLQQKPDGTMAPAMRYPGVTDKIKRIWVCDLNQDQIRDMVTLTEDAEYPLWACLGDSQGKLGPGMRVAMPSPRDMEIAYFLPNSRSPEVVSISSEGGRVLVHSWQFSGKAEQETVLHYAFSGGESADKRDITAGDLDGDGLTDAVVSDPDRAEFIFYRGQADGSFAEPATYPGLKEMQKLTTAALGGGAGESLVCLSIKEKIIGVSRYENGRITFPAVVDLAGDPLAMDTADINGDGSIDIVYIAKEKEKDKQKPQFFMRSVLNLGKESAAAGPELEIKELKDPPVDIRAADLDQDGTMDVLIYRSFGPAILLRQASVGTWVQVSDTEKNSGLVSSLTPAGTTVAALGEDAKPVLLAAQKEFARSLTFGAEKGWKIVDQYAAGDPQSRLTAVQAIAKAGQKDRQIVAYDSARQKLVFLGRQDDGTYRTEKEIAVGNLDIKKIIPLASLGGGSSRLLLAGPRKMVLLQMLGQSITLRQAADFEPDIKNGKYGQISVGDLNGDSQPDLILCEQVKNHIEILTANGGTGLECGYKFKVFESPRGVEEHFGKEGGREPQYALAADVTGDGKNDLIVLVHDRIIIYPQE